MVFSSAQTDCPPVPVAVGSPVCARKSFDTMGGKQWIGWNIRTGCKKSLITIEKSVEIVIIDFTQLEKVLASFGAGFNFEVDDYIAKRSLQEDRHGEEARSELVT